MGQQVSPSYKGNEREREKERERERERERELQNDAVIADVPSTPLLRMGT